MAARVLILFGGRSAEHEISILSARFVVGALDPARFEPLLVGIAPSGSWHLLDAVPAGDARSVRVDTRGPRVHLAPIPGQRGLCGDRDEPFDVAFPVLHGPFGEDGCIQGLFELAGVPYVGSGVGSSAVGMDKIFQKQILAQAEISVVPYLALRRFDWERDRQGQRAHIADELGDYPLFVKPANMGSSRGVHKVSREEELDAAIEDAFCYDDKLVIERALRGAREIECAVLGNDDPRASIPGEIRVQHPDGFYSYDAKYLDPDGAALDIPAKLYATEQHLVQLIALRAFRALDARGFARVDMFLDESHTLYVNEVNTIPGFTEISMFPALWRASGVDPESLITTLIDLALDRR